jgi:hypothetical protein
LKGCSAGADFFAYLLTLDDLIASPRRESLIVDGKVIWRHRGERRHRFADDTISQAGVTGLE